MLYQLSEVALSGRDTRVDHYLEWIDEEMRSRCEDGTRVWCEVDGIIPPGFAEAAVADDGEDVKVTGCGCSQGSVGNAGWWALGLVGLLVRRRQ